MRPREFLDLAVQLLDETSPAAYRSAISRAYYAVFNAADEFLQRMGFDCPKKDYHVILQRRMLVSDDAELVRIGSDLGDLHGKRIRADYKMGDKSSENRNNAQAVVEEAAQMIELLENCPIYSDRWKRIKKAIQKMG